MLGVFRMASSSSIPVQLHPGIPHDQLVAMINQNFESLDQKNVLRIADSGTVTFDQFNASFFGTGTGKAIITHNLRYVPIVFAFFEDPLVPGSYKQWASEIGTVNMGSTVEIKSYHERLLSANTSTVTFTENYYWTTPATALAGPYTIKYYLLQEVAN